MNENVQTKLAELQEKGWTLASIARELGQATVTVESWKAGKRSPANLQPVLESLNRLIKVKRIPPKKIYAKGSRKAKFTEDMSNEDKKES
jgi:transcriptional regulator with XRE-family HTH domain